MRLKSRTLSTAVGTALTLSALSALAAEVTLPPVSIGAGVRTSFTHSEIDVPGSQDVDDFELNSARIYLSGKATENISIMLNTEYNTTGAIETIRVIDAAAQFSFSDEVNIWAGRFLPPSDRANLYGPYYASHWGVYRDGIQDGYPFETEGRADGVMYWGQFGIAKVSAGVFDIEGLTKGSSDVLSAARVQLDFWDPEAGYYLNGTYYGDKDLLAIGVAGQNASGNNAFSADFLLEKNFSGAGVLTVESEFAKYDGLGGYPSPRTGAYETSKGYYALVAYMLPADIGPGKLQFLGKMAKAEFDYATDYDVEQTTLELNVNYLIRQFNARISAFYIDTEFEEDGTGTVPVFDSIAPDSQVYGIGLQVQM